jgi:hypothetical protein
MRDQSVSTRGKPGSNGYDAIVTLTESNIFHGEFSLSQLLVMCPAPVCSQYRAPVDYLYPCGTGTHPGGGGVTGLPATMGGDGAASPLRLEHCNLIPKRALND